MTELVQTYADLTGHSAVKLTNVDWVISRALEVSMFYGGDYNPEQWPEVIWMEDARLMREAGVNLVSLGVFSWAYLEPRPGRFEFLWLDRVVDLLHEHGVSVNLATATASPPAWLAHDHPETLPVTAGGGRRPDPLRREPKAAGVRSSQNHLPPDGSRSRSSARTGGAPR
jgi:hypothetical protein